MPVNAKFPGRLATTEDFANDRAFVEEEVAAMQAVLGEDARQHRSVRSALSSIPRKSKVPDDTIRSR